MQQSSSSPQPVTSQNNVRKGMASTLRIQAPALFPQIALALGDSDTSTLSSADSDLPPFERAAAQRSARRNMKKLSLSIPSAQSSVQSLHMSSSSTPPNSREKHRRPSIASLPAISLLHRRDEDTGSPVPYADGPVQVIPGIWIGSEDNARDWNGLLERRIRSILNVAKEVSSPLDAYPASQALRSAISTPNFKSHAESDPTYYPPHVPTGRPGMHYLKLDWSHGQQDLVNHGFKDGMAFVDAAVDRGEGCLIHCQCGISRSATMVIALVMRAAAERHSSVPSDIWALQGMQAAYDYVKEKSPCVGPNMSLIYQLLEYEKALKRNKGLSPQDSDASSVAEDEEEWTRKRRLWDETPPDVEQNDSESIIVMQEAKALDKAMEDRIVARKSSASSMSSIGSASGIGMGSAWRSRYGRKRTPSTSSSKTNGSLSEDLVEEEEEAELLGIGGGFDNDSHQAEVDSSPDSCSPDDEHKGTPRNVSNLSLAIQPPTAPPWKTSFTCPSPLTAVPPLFDAPTPPPLSPPKPKVKRRPVSLSVLPAVTASPTNFIVETDLPAANESRGDALRIPPRPTRRRSESRISRPPPLRQSVLQRGAPNSNSTDSVSSVASQTLFVFPPSPTLMNARTPSTMTLFSNPSGPIPFPILQTPRVSTKGKRKSFIGLTPPPAPTIGLAKVDALGYVGVEVSSL